MQRSHACSFAGGAVHTVKPKNEHIRLGDATAVDHANTYHANNHAASMSNTTSFLQQIGYHVRSRTTSYIPQAFPPEGPTNHGFSFNREPTSVNRTKEANHTQTPHELVRYERRMKNTFSNAPVCGRCQYGKT